MIHRKSQTLTTYENYLLTESKKSHKLSGIIVIVENRILLVKPWKFRGMNKKWSIPKGRIEDKNKFKSALKELKEESGLDLSNIHQKDFIKNTHIYIKNSITKKLTSYTINLNKEDLYITIDNNWEIPSNEFSGDEIYRAKFFKIKDVFKKIEKGQLALINKSIRK